jgi:phosphatidylserine decarboxylase
MSTMSPVTSHAGAGSSTLPDLPAPIIAREGWPIVAIFILISIALAAAASFLHPIAGTAVGLVGLILTLWCLWFFRDPARNIPADPAAVISPADGVVCAIGPADALPELQLGQSGRGMLRICVFMNVFNVHVNRMPLSGTVTRIVHSPGKFLNAAVDKASTENERCAMAIAIPDGRIIGCVQIAGLVARRIICRISEGTQLERGNRYGLIRFGSRVDVYLPADSVVNVAIGQTVVAGETTLARLTAVGG